MPPQYDLSWILPYVRESLRGRGNLSFDNYMEGLWEVLHRVGISGVEKRAAHQGYAGTSFNFDAAPQDLKLVAIEACVPEQNSALSCVRPSSVASLLSHTQGTITQRPGLG